MNSKLKSILKYVCFVIIGIAILIVIIFHQAFGTEEETIEIEQLIGGKLICESTYMADIQSWYYFIDYKYQRKDGKIIEIGKGEYFSREWEKNEQLQQIGEWLILKTGGEFKTDKLLIGKEDSSNWKVFEISPDKIVKDSLWKSENIYVNQMRTPNEVFIKEIINNRIEVDYLFRTGEKYENQSTRKITYEFDEKKGIPIMAKIK